MRRFIFILLFCICLESFSVFAGDNVLHIDVGNIEASIGDTVEVDIYLKNNPGIVAALFSLNYDVERLKLISVTDSGLLPGGTFGINYDSLPFVMLWNSASKDDYTETGVLAVLKFKVLNSAKPGDANITLAYDEDDIYNVDLTNVPVKISNGILQVQQPKTDTSSYGAHYTGTENSITGLPETESREVPPETFDNKIVFAINKKETWVYGKLISNDVAPVIRNGQTMLPARLVAESLGAEVGWQEISGDIGVVTILKNNTVIQMKTGENIAYVNNEEHILDHPIFIEEERTYTPMRFVAESLGAKVEWDEDTQTVSITGDAPDNR